MPYQRKTYTFNLEPVGCPEMEVECLDPSSMPAARRNELQQSLAILTWYQSEQNRRLPMQPEDRWALAEIDAAIRRSIVRWTCTYSPAWCADQGRPDLEGVVIPLHYERRPFPAPAVADPGPELVEPGPKASAAKVAEFRQRRRDRDDYLAYTAALAAWQAAEDEAARTYDPLAPVPAEVCEFIGREVSQHLLTPPKSN